MGLCFGQYDAKEEGFVPGGASCTIKCRRTDLTRKRLKKRRMPNLKPQKLSGTMAFMFESRYIIRPTEFAMKTSELQHEYFEVWQKLEKEF